MNHKTYNKFPKGSQWRKWDLHLHTPYTNLNPYTATDEQFISKLKAEEISAVALTNYYFFKDEEFTLKSKLESEGITTFLNLELRSSYTNTDEKCCDIHVIFSDDVSKEEIQNLLVKLSLNVGAAKKMAHGLKPQDLQSATVDFWHLHEILNDEALGLQGRFFIGFLSRGHGNARSSSNFETVYAKSDFLLHSTDKGSNLEEDREFWLKNRRPLFQSSDAHSLEKIGTKFSWIKSAPTFEGLKQVIYEPEERICLEVTKPDQKPTYQVIDSLDLSNSGLWEGKIEL
ncbi:ATPase, partial [Vibrio vulnificus]|nr:ATPase [Vibrio vulnificus]